MHGFELILKIIENKPMKSNVMMVLLSAAAAQVPGRFELYKGRAYPRGYSYIMDETGKTYHKFKSASACEGYLA